MAQSLWGQSSYDQCSQGEELLNNGEYEKAVYVFNQCIDAHEGYGAAYYYRGTANYLLGYTSKALRDYQTAIELTPEYINTYYALSEHFLAENNLNKAIYWLDKAIAQEPEMEYHYNYRGWVYFNFGKYQSAFKDFTKAIELDPESASAYNNRGNARFKLQDIAEAHEKDLLMAKADYQKTLVLNDSLPLVYIVHRNLGYINYKLGEYEEALINLDTANHLNPKDPMIYLYRGRVLNALGKQQEAIVEFDRAIFNYKRLAGAYLERGKVYYELNNMSEAEFNFNKTIGLEDEYAGEAHYYLAMLYAGQSKEDLMLTHLQKAQRNNYFEPLDRRKAIKSEPAFAPYREQKQFASFVKKL